MATNKVLFLSVDYLRDNTIVNGNVDSELLEPYILMAQNIHIESCVGTKIYNELISTIASLSANDKLLMDDYIQPALLQWSLYEALPFINYKFTNKAISTKSSDNSEAVSLDELHYLREVVKNAAQYLSERITVYLKANTDIYPLYLTNSDCDDIRPNKTNYNSGIVLD
jgi:hypothetical protein